MHTGKCHCGNVVLAIPYLTKKATRCNCSICNRYSAVWGYFEEGEVKVSVGEHGVSAYSQGDKTISFVACKKCLCITHYTSLNSMPDATLAVNYRMFDVELMSDMEFRYFDGAETWSDMEKDDWIQDG